MAKINYGFEKRQRELAKQKKQDAKDARKREARAAKATAGSDTAPAAEVDGVADAPADTASAPRVHLRTPGTD